MHVTEAAKAGIARHLGDLLEGLDPTRYSQMAVLPGAGPMRIG